MSLPSFGLVCNADIASLSVDAELRKAMMELPAFFQPDPTDRPGTSTDGENPTRVDQMSPTDQVRHYEKIMLSVAIHSRMLRLHRPWLSKGYTEEKFAYSKEQCIRAARATLRIMGDTGGTAAFLEKWWYVQSYLSKSKGGELMTGCHCFTSRSRVLSSLWIFWYVVHSERDYMILTRSEPTRKTCTQKRPSKRSPKSRGP